MNKTLKKLALVLPLAVAGGVWAFRSEPELQGPPWADFADGCATFDGARIAFSFDDDQLGETRAFYLHASGQAFPARRGRCCRLHRGPVGGVQGGFHLIRLAPRPRAHRDDRVFPSRPARTDPGVPVRPGPPSRPELAPVSAQVKV
jgi:hypothetical protein